ncbi:conserved hypothetical protein [Leptothrix cholodnii SP-6]|uniref:DUF3108 domain-containing protein n=1 Tax=Leptothrix cholodnii (strain ATCC 51168 / LMG 8142 / SP-6) TaxID=395495 RepID=B1Y7U2_LEPCP|nr:DUF3108 domain-containing protein [Leptothrix cholodnii]ACB32540.1 conserved hypothetical protein [Leptothrix cholodnii SP-6]
MRRPALAWAALAALLLHLLALDELHESMQSIDFQKPAMERLEAVYTRVLAPVEPVEVSAPAARPTARRANRAAVVAAAASAPAEAASAAAASAAESVARAADEAASAALAGIAPGVDEAASAPTADLAAAAASASAAAGEAGPDGSTAGEPAASAVARAAPASAPASPQAGASAPLPAFSWPASTRLSYKLDGWYNGEVLGQAQVEWLRHGERYQVHLDVSVGPSFAPLVRRRMSSDGRITADGLAPQRYEQETTQIIGRDRRVQMAFSDTAIVLSNGERVPAQADVQDTASQFIQIIYLLTTRPALRQVGQSIEFGLALPKRVDRWVYEVVERVVVETPLGPIPTLHVKPRRRAAPGNLTAQMWYAPSLQMLPVRIRIEQDEGVWIDLRLERAPEQSGP